MHPFDVIMLNMSSYAEWLHGVNNRNYHVLDELVRSSDVRRILAVDYPPLTFKRALRNYKENVLMSLPEGKVRYRSLTERLTEISDKLSVYSNCTFYKSPERFMQRLKAVAERLELRDMVVWSFFPPAMKHTGSLGQRLTVFDAVDNWAEHSSYRQFVPMLKENYAYIKEKADIIFTVADELQKLFDNQPNVYWIPNGVDLAHYQTPRRLVNRDIADIQRPIVGYIGIIQDRVDVDMIVDLARMNPDKSFVMVGPVWSDRDKQRLETRENVHVLGYKSYDEAPAYIQQFDVALIPHKVSTFITSTNPMKVYEYLACGKPVVATRHSGAEMFQDAVYLAADTAEFHSSIGRALVEDSSDKQRMRRDAVREYSWSATVSQMLMIVKKKLTY
ncbi:MAG: hypothetical protein A3B31_00370 [Candidatus Komeilibacteria bacterium RIFCSPLOWO2_01_FULL_53_11]|uniref:Glycosyltransferase subfamily 4-like N-terminal domain-containing protein n=1 Tax=Candidatus Komeilibacteria bacterium RIFCSPLOWO2_01_FULL_53_11 TaxID=1798552 RepID=A0A1G2BXR3_9BACT|nr:MAG: hypothetical protein A3B31_00370 [Candidatus Komeilibacteria bacterium RIFCSPLOWO2_01_FULL_53_11]